MKKRTRHSHHEYFGCLIHRNTEPHKLRWWAFTREGQVAADTLQGIRSHIKNIEERHRSHIKNIEERHREK